jgi:hypothetical protein
MTATAPERAGPSSSRRAFSRRAKITVKGARCARVAGAMALRATLDTDLSRQRSGTCREDGGRADSYINGANPMDTSRVYRNIAIGFSQSAGPTMLASFGETVIPIC